jgi:hypothetical protein
MLHTGQLRAAKKLLDGVRVAHAALPPPPPTPESLTDDQRV